MKEVNINIEDEVKIDVINKIKNITKNKTKNKIVKAIKIIFKTEVVSKAISVAINAVVKKPVKVFMLISFLNSWAMASGPSLDLSVFDTLDISPIQVQGKILPNNAKAIKLSEAYHGRWVILDVSATWCPYCKLDQMFFAAHKNTINEHTTEQKLWTKDVVHINLNIEMKDKGPRQQTKDVIRKFLNPKSIAEDKHLKGLNRDHMDTLLVNNMDLKTLKLMKDKNGQLILKDFGGYPYQMVFNPKGELVFQGNFTSKIPEDGDDWAKPYSRHYEKLTKMIQQ